jgi:hypothetical protein
VDETATAAGTARLPRPTPATAIFVATRMGIWLLAGFTLAWFPRHGGGFGTTLWVRSDSNWYLAIAHHGYAPDPQHYPAFFPLFPTLIAGLGQVLDDYALAGLLISLAACAAAFELLRYLAERHAGRAAATRSVLYLALFPMAVFLGAVYSESLFLALALGAFVLAERGHWPAAAVAAGAATLTRSVGVAVLAGLVVIAWPDIRKLAWLVIAPVMFAAFPLALQLQVHDPWAFVHAQDEWERHVSPWGPFGGLWYAIRALWRADHNFTEHFYLAVNIESLVFLAVFIALIPLVWRHVGAAYAVFTAVVLAVPMSVPSDRGDFPLFSMPRFTVLAFPCFIALAVIGRRPTANTAIVAASSAMLGVAIVQWTLATLS